MTFVFWYCVVSLVAGLLTGRFIHLGDGHGH